jgi:hypothetical protein
VSNLRKIKYSERSSADFLKDKNLLVRFCLVADSLGLDKHSAGKFCRLFKLVNTFDEFKSKVPQEAKAFSDDLQFILENFERPALLETVRMSLLPTKTVTLTPAQKQGYNLLQALETARQDVLGEYDARERQLTAQIKKLRQERDEFGRQLAHVIPQWGQVRRARDTTLSAIEREGLVGRHEASDDLRARYTVEGYLATARANKVQEAERATYDGFRRLDSEASVRARVLKARDAAAGQAAPTAGSVEEGQSDPLQFAPL